MLMREKFGLLCLVCLENKVRITTVLLIEPHQPAVEHILRAPNKITVTPATLGEGFDEPKQVQCDLPSEISTEIDLIHRFHLRKQVRSGLYAHNQSDRARHIHVRI